MNKSASTLLITGRDSGENDPDGSFTLKFRTPILSKDMQISLAKLNIYFSWQNITTAFANNSFTYLWPNGSGGEITVPVTIPNGYYSVSALNDFLHFTMVQNKHYLIDNNGNSEYYLSFRENSTYYALEVDCLAMPTTLASGWSYPTGYSGWALGSGNCPRLSTGTSNIYMFFGLLKNTTYPSTMQTTTQEFLSTTTPIVSPVASVIVRCNRANNPYSNDSQSIYLFSPDVGYGSMISVEPHSFLPIDLISGQFQDLTISLTDQNGNNLVMLDYDCSMLLYLTHK